MKGSSTSREAVWVASNPPGVERCVVSTRPSGWLLEGALVRRFKAGPALISYHIETDRGWRTRRVRIEQVLQGRHQRLEAEARNSSWYVHGNHERRLDGCVDVDLGASPVTNTLPIKRARVKVGSKLELTAAWVKFPELIVEPLQQSYERTGERTFIYRSASGFTSEISVDAFGLVSRYGKYWLAL